MSGKSTMLTDGFFPEISSWSELGDFPERVRPTELPHQLRVLGPETVRPKLQGRPKGLGPGEFVEIAGGNGH